MRLLFLISLLFVVGCSTNSYYPQEPDCHDSKASDFRVFCEYENHSLEDYHSFSCEMEIHSWPACDFTDYLMQNYPQYYPTWDSAWSGRHVFYVSSNSYEAALIRVKEKLGSHLDGIKIYVVNEPDIHVTIFYKGQCPCAVTNKTIFDHERPVTFEVCDCEV